MALRVRTSKFRHVYGVQCRREQTFENVRITRNTHDSNFCSVNPRFLAIATESSGGGSFAILDVNRPGRVDVNCPRVCGHEGAIMDIKWNPFDDCVIASGSDDATVKIWTVPKEGLLGTLTDWSADLHGHSRRVGYVEWHTTAANVLMSVGFDFKIMIWNVEQAEPITSLDCHQDTIFSVSWGHDGSLIASTSKDKQIRIMDPRTARVAMKTDGHQSAKTSKISFVTESQVFTTGFSRVSDRQYALWDIRKAGTPLVIEDLDSSSGILLPYYDPDTKVVYLAGKGDGNIRYFEIEVGAVQFLNTYQSSLPQRGLGMMPKRGIDPLKNEVARFYKLHASKNLVEPVSMIIPRKAEGFQPDVFPPTASTIPSLTADEWTSGVNRGPILVDLQTGAILDKPRSTMSPALMPQIPALSKPPQITTCKAISRAPPTSFSPAPFIKQTSPSSLRTSPEGHAQVFAGSPSHMPRTVPANQMFGSVNGKDKQQLEPASIRNIKCLSMSQEDNLDSDFSQLHSQSYSPASTISSGQGRSSRSPASPLSFVSPPPPPSSTSVNHHNGFSGHSAADEHPSGVGVPVTGTKAPCFTQPSGVGVPVTGTKAPCFTQPSGVGVPVTGTKAPVYTPLSPLPRLTGYTHVPHDRDLHPLFGTIPASTSNDHISEVKMLFGPAATISHSDQAIHVRKVWSPPAEPATSVTPGASASQSGGATPGTDLELKKAYFRQLEEIRSLQEQLVLKDRRIQQLEADLSHFKDRETDLKPGESNC